MILSEIIERLSGRMLGRVPLQKTSFYSIYMSRLTVATVRDEFVRRLTEKRGPLDVLRNAARVLHDVPRQGLFTPEFHPIFYDIVSFYRQQNYIDQGLEHSFLQTEDLLLVEKSIKYFLESVCRAINAKELVLPVLAARNLEPSVKYANFMAGVFALVRGESDNAALFFIDAADLWGVKTTEISALCEKNPDQAAARLGKKFQQIKTRLTSPAAVQAESRQVPPREYQDPPPPPAQRRREVPVPPPPKLAPARSQQPKPEPAASPAPATARQIPDDPARVEREWKAAFDEAESEATKQKFPQALCRIMEAVALKPDDKRTRETFGHILRFTYGWVKKEKEPVTVLQRARELISIKRDESEAHLIAARQLITLKRFPEAQIHLAAAKRLPQKENEQQETEYLEGLCFYRQGKEAEALAVFEKMPAANPYYVRAGRLRLLIYFANKDKGSYDSLLAELIKRGNLPSYDVKQFRARQLYLEDNIKGLERAGELIEDAVREARADEKPESVKNIRVLGDKIQSRFFELRAAAKRTEPPPPPLPPSPPAPTEPPKPVVEPANNNVAVELTRRAAELNEREKELTERSAALDAREAAYLESNKKIDALMERRRAELDKLEAALKAIPPEPEAKIGRRVVEVGRVELTESVYKGIMGAFRMILAGRFNEARDVINQFAKRHNDDLIKALLMLLDLVITTRAAEKIKGERTEARTKADGRLQPVTFTEAWEMLLGMEEAERKEISPLFADILKVEEAFGPRALSVDEVLTRRREMFAAIIAKLEENPGYNTTDMVRIDTQLGAKINNKRAFPWGAKGTIDLAKQLKSWLNQLNVTMQAPA